MTSLETKMTSLETTMTSLETTMTSLETTMTSLEIVPCGYSEWIAAHESTLASLSSPIYLPMIIPPRPCASLSEGGYLVTPLKLLKRQANRRAQQLLENANLAIVFSAVNAMQGTAFRINKEIYRDMRKAWNAGHRF